MGCTPSAVRVRTQREQSSRRAQAFDPFSFDNQQVKNPNQKQISPKIIFQKIVNGIKSISKPADMVPQVCVGDSAFPIATSNFKLDENDSTNFRLPIISCATKGNGQIACVSSIEYLLGTYFNSYDTMLFFKQLTHMLTNCQRTFAHTYCIGFSKQDLKNYKQAFEAMGLFIEGGEFPDTLSHQVAVILNSSYELTAEQMDILYNFVTESGKGLIVFYNTNDDAPNINDFLMRFGLRYTNLIITDDNDFLEILPDYNRVGTLTFHDISSNYISMLKSDQIKPDAFQELVASLRIYVIASGDENTERLSELLDASWNFLKATNYIKDGKLFQTQQQSTVSMLIIDLMQKLPLELLKPIEGYETFPGKTGNVELKDFELDITISSMQWASTGLWLPAGEIANIKISESPPAALVQIGSHSEKNLTKLPWERWPTLIVSEMLSADSVSVGSPFGGIVYLMIGEEDEEAKEYNVHVTFEHFCEHPRYVIGQPETWERTKDIEVPWGEIETDNAVITIPSENMRKIDIEKFSKSFEILISNLKKFVNMEWIVKFRIVFDVMCEVGKPQFSYPIVYNINEIDDFVQSVQKPNALIFTLLSAIANLMLEAVSIDEATRLAVSAVGAASAISELYPDFSPKSMQNIDLSNLFYEFWEIHTKIDKTVIPKVIRSISEQESLQSDVPEDMWILFVRKLSAAVNKDLTGLLSKSRPIPLSVINSLHTLAPYQAEV